MPTISTAGLVPDQGISNNDNTAALNGLPVDAVTTTWRTVYRVVAPCAPGDVFRVHGEFSVTNDVGYTVGVGCHLWYYDADADVQTWLRIGDSEGQNVPVVDHHLAMDISRWLKVPATWPLGHRVVFALRADAHSTAWQSGDVLTVDKLGQIEALRWTTPGPDRVAALEAQLADLTARVAALEAAP